MISLCAVLSGAEDCEEIAAYGDEKYDFFSQYLNLPNGIPSHDTFNRVLRHLNPKSFSNCLTKWSREIIEELTERYQINIDGKVLKGTGKRGKKTAAICLVSAWAAKEHLSLGQVKVDTKSNEKTAIPQLLEDLDVKDALVSIDAIGCNQAIAAQIISKEGDYLLALKRNQKVLYEEVMDWMTCRKDNCSISFDKYEATDYVAGRIEQRTVYVCNNLKFIDELQNWKNCRSIIMVNSERCFKNAPDDVSTQTRFYISSALGKAKLFHDFTKGHWSIENNLHWQLDVVFAEDRQRIRKDNGAENFAILRKMALQLITLNKGKQSLKKARKRVAWSQDFLIQILNSISCV